MRLLATHSLQSSRDILDPRPLICRDGIRVRMVFHAPFEQRHQRLGLILGLGRQQGYYDDHKYCDQCADRQVGSDPCIRLAGLSGSCGGELSPPMK
jgi:hypothetical protein